MNDASAAGSPPRLAWFSPLPPIRTGVAACSAELIRALRARGHLIDAYPEAAAHDFPWRHRQRPYDLVVYQFGNSSHHDYAWAYALRYPGLVVLHDTRLHHARAAFLLRERRTEDYRAELRWCHPELAPGAAEIAAAGFDCRLFYEWPMVRGLIETARIVAVHGEATRRELMERLADAGAPAPAPGAGTLVSVRVGHGAIVPPDEERDARRRLRTRLGIAEDAVVFGAFGGLTPDKRIPQILSAFRATLAHAPGARLLLGGAAAADFDLGAAIAQAAAGRADFADAIAVTGYVDRDDAFGDLVAGVDVSLNLRWPTARETSGPWLHALAAGKPTVITDLAHLTGVASLDPRTWQVNPAVGDRSSPPMCVAIDVLDEDHSLRLAMRRLAQDPGLRAALGGAARAYWTRTHAIDAVADDYERLIARAIRLPDPDPRLPAHMRPDGGGALRALTADLGLGVPW